ncbi:MAG: reverse transcriptase domain-containing protein [Cyanobacteria bacterium J06582_2]
MVLEEGFVEETREEEEVQTRPRESNREALVGGRLADFSENWSDSCWAASITKHGLGWKWSSDPPKSKPFHQSPSPQLLEFVNKALKKGAVEISKKIVRQNRLFDVPKKDTTERRVILDLKKLNQFIPCETFKMTTVAQVRKILPKGSWAASIDLKDAYWHVPIAPKFRKFLGFRLGNISYRFKVMPFGLNIAPRMFTKLVSVIVKSLRRLNVSVVAYLDDWLVWGQSKKECETAVNQTLQEIDRRGFIVNLEKSKLTPSQNFQWLGIQWNLKNATLSLPLEKQKGTSKTVRTFLGKKVVTRRDLEKLLGKLQFCAISDPWLKVTLKNLNKYWLRSAFNRLRDRSHILRRNLKVALSPYSKAAAFRRKTLMKPGPVTHVIHTDASKWGWGGHSSDDQMTSGRWSAVMSRCHINFLELRAADLVLRKFNPPRRAHIKLVMDNATAVFCITRGGSKSTCLNDVMKSIVKLSIRKQWTLSAVHLSGIQNVLADSLSRHGPISTEWKLDKKSFAQVMKMNPKPQIDMFATSENHQLEVFVSPLQENKAVAQNAFQLDWNSWKTIYLFPPTPLISKVLNQLESFSGTAYLIAPDWPNSLWHLPLSKRAKFKIHLKNATLSQVVRGETYYASSLLSRDLHIWVF